MGIGINKKNLGEIFKPFFQEEEWKTHTKLGIGMGLLIAKHVCKLHGGKN